MPAYLFIKTKIQDDVRRMAHLVLLIAMSGLCLSCYSTYTGIYFTGAKQVINLRQATQKIFEAIGDLGFAKREPHLLDKSPKMLPTNGLRLEGDDASVSVALWGDPLGITLRDYSNTEETEFTREVKRRIELCLRENYGLENLEFRRQLEFPLVPNS